MPLIDGDDVYMEFKSGTFTSVTHWETQTWNEKRLRWQHGHLVDGMEFPERLEAGALSASTATVRPGSRSSTPCSPGSFIYVPGAGGSIFKLNKSNGARSRASIPFGPHRPRHLHHRSADRRRAGNIYYNAIKLATASLGRGRGELLAGEGRPQRPIQNAPSPR